MQMTIDGEVNFTLQMQNTKIGTKHIILFGK